LLVAIEDEVKFKGNKDLLYAKRCKMFYFHEQTLDIIDRVFFNMTSEFYHEKSQFTTLLHECMEIWANGIDGNAADYFAKLNIRTQRSIPLLCPASSTFETMLVNRTLTTSRNPT